MGAYDNQLVSVWAESRRMALDAKQPAAIAHSQ
jgi:hypothetical protein